MTKNKTEYLYLTLIKTPQPFIVSEDLARSVGVTKGRLARIVRCLVLTGVLDARQHRPDGRKRGPYHEYTLTGRPYVTPPRKTTEAIHDDKADAGPRIRRLYPEWQWPSLTAMLMGDPPLGYRSTPTHMVVE